MNHRGKPGGVGVNVPRMRYKALVFVFGQVLGQPLGNRGEMILAQPKRRFRKTLEVVRSVGTTCTRRRCNGR